MALLLIIWLIIYFITFILGFGVVRLSGADQTTKLTAPELVVAGLVSIISITQIVSLVWPTNFWSVGFLIVLAGFINWRLQGQPFKNAFASVRQLAGKPLLWLLLGAVLVFSARSAMNGDSGLYHIPAIRWYERFRAIPGLGNLHGRLAFNSSFFVVSAAFGFTDIIGQTLFALNGFIVLIFGAYVLTEVNSSKGIPGLGILQVLLVGLVFYFLLYQVSSPNPDVWATILPLFLFVFWLNGVSNASEARFYLLVALIAACLTVKLGTVPLLLFLPFLLLIHRNSLGLKQILAVGVVCGIIIGPWLIRNVILSGYLVYPFPALDLFSVDWKIPMKAVLYEQDYVTFWGRFHQFESLIDPVKLAWSPAQWVPLWWAEQGNTETYGYFMLNRPLFIVACLSPVLMAFYGFRFGFRPFRLWAAYIVTFAGFLFWFLKAPEFRFGYAFLWMTTLLPCAIVAGRLPFQLKKQLLFWPIGMLLLYSTATMIYSERQTTVRSWLVPNWFGYKNRLAGGSSYQPHRTKSGLVVLVPEPFPYEQRCYELDALCSPYFFEDMEMRGNSIETGFRRRPTAQPSTSFNSPSSNEIQHRYPRLQ